MISYEGNLIGLHDGVKQWYWIDDNSNTTNWCETEHGTERVAERRSDCCGTHRKCLAVNWDRSVVDVVDHYQFGNIDCNNASSAMFVCKKEI